MSAAELEAFQRALADALRAEDPVAATRRLADAPELHLDGATRAAILSADPDGLRLTALLVAKLRFERIVRGSDSAGAWFDQEPAAFSAAFRRYHWEVPPTAAFPAAEARDFLEWAARNGLEPPAPWW